MYFTKEEKAAMYYYFSHMALADGVVENSEIQLGAIIGAKMGITEEEINLSSEYDVNKATPIISSMNFEKKELFASLLVFMMGVDGDISPNEVFYWKLVCEACKLPNISPNEALRIGRNFLE